MTRELEARPATKEGRNAHSKLPGCVEITVYKGVLKQIRAERAYFNNCVDNNCIKKLNTWYSSWLTIDHYNELTPSNKNSSQALVTCSSSSSSSSELSFFSSLSEVMEIEHKLKLKNKKKKQTALNFLVLIIMLLILALLPVQEK